MTKMQSALGACLVILTVASCDFPQLPGLAGGGDGGDGTTGDGGSPASSLELLAGDIGGAGSEDGVGSTARFAGPTGTAVDGAGNVYVADGPNYTIRKVTAAGVVTTLAGTAGIAGSVDGTGAAARFSGPTGVASDSAGNVYVADQGNGTIRKITTAGVVTTLAGAAGMTGSTDGTGAAARFRNPAGVAVDGAGNVYVADQSNHILRKVTPAGVVTTLAGMAPMPGSADGTGAAARFDHPTGVAVDGAGNVYVADQFNSTLRKVTAAGVVTTLAGTAGLPGSADGAGTAALFNFPTGVAIDDAGSLYVADRGNATVRKITTDGAVTTLAGAAGMPGTADGTSAAARFSDPFGVAVDGGGNVYVADANNHTLRKVAPGGGVTTLAGAAAMIGSTDGIGATARFRTPSGVAADGAGNVYVADQGNDTIRKITTAGVVTTLAGTAGAKGTVDGAGAAARFVTPWGVAVAGPGDLYVADGNTIRKITAAGVVTTLAGNPDGGSADGVGSAASFNGPMSVAVDDAGNVYVADTSSNTIRKVTATGVVTTLAGLALTTGSADGVGAAARFNGPAGVAVDGAGNVYVADQLNCSIRKITPGGVVATLAGAAHACGNLDGTGAAARFDQPFGVTVDRVGNVYVADQFNHEIRKITPDGVTTTVAGTAGMSGILLGTAPRFMSPQSLAVMNDSLVLSDANAILLLRHGAR